MVRTVLNCGVDHMTRGAVFIIILDRHKPLTRVSAILRHMRGDQVGVIQNVGNLARIHPNAENAASPVAII
jgi:hypothetical protein